MSRLQYLLAALAAGALLAHAPARAAAPEACSWDRPGHDSIEGSAGYEPQIRDMHFGQGRVCASVSRDRWSDGQRERALVYCEGGDCVMVPTVCRNVSRIARVPGGGGAPVPPGEGELPFDPPGAGAPAPVPEGSVPPLSTLPPSPLTGIPAIPPGSFASPPPVSIGPPSAGPPISIPTPPIFVLPPRVEEVPTPVVPEPSTLAMAAAGLALLMMVVRRASSSARALRRPSSPP